ncbi:MAG: UvrD-helicase domain-containing protein [Methylococcales bacterium]|nr:UvrD-helicase domain-containing protein [Methylococcales bacterium]
MKMDAKSKLQTNFIGKLFGIDAISIEDKSLVALKKGRDVSKFSIGNSMCFATYESMIFGGRLVLKDNNHKRSFKFLKSDGAIEFLESLNLIIADNITQYITSSFDIFTKCVFEEYPRDSKINLLTNLCLSISETYSNQESLWKKYIVDEMIDKGKLLASYHPVDPSNLRKEHEAIFLEKRKQFFNRVESNPLTNEQRLGVLRSNDRNMVLAAAGTGKTSVIVAKTLDLIDRKLAFPSEILVLAYNRDAAKELQERLTDKAGISNIDLKAQPQISTFHALGLKLLRESGISTYLSVFTEDDFKLKQWVTTWIEDYIRADTSRVYNLIELSTQPVNPFDFKTKADYERYIRDNEFRTLNNELVKGYQEFQIANFLFINQIPYKYEAPYVSKRRIDIGFDYKPDFYLEGTNIYIEHFGVDRNNKTRQDIDAIKYLESMNSKRALHKEYETVLIETFHYEWCENTFLSGLEEKLSAKGIKLDLMAPNEIFEKLNKEGHIANWSDLMKKALQAIRVERLTKDAMQSRFKQAKIHRPEKYSELLEALHKGYIAELKEQNAIDFDDMIIRAIQVVTQGVFTPKWKYILVDEFQDISAARMEFISALIEKGPDPSLTVVGDDWQSIYRFSGGKLELTTRFGEMVGAYTETKLQKTFRYNNSIANTAGQFIMENPEQFKKHIETHSKVDQPQVFLLDDKVGNQEGVYERVVEVVKKIRDNDLSGSIALIARYNYLLQDAKQSLTNARLSKNINFWSFHRSKGLEADYCILIGFFQGKSGFPNENRNEAIIEALLPSLDSYPHSEERRLLYVGITRARHKSYIIADPTAPSDFITELLAPKYELNIVSKTFQEQYRKIFKCPNCEDGYLRLINGKFGEFYSCSTGLGCNVGKARVCSKCKAPSIDTRNASICNNTACRNTIKICDECGRPMKIRDGKFGRFWGCTGFGIKDDQCKNTSRA